MDARLRLEPFKHLLLGVLVVLTFYPFAFMLMTSFKNNDQFFHFFWTPTLPLELVNYLYAWNQVNRYLLNSILISGASIAGVLLVASLSAYAFARAAFPGREFLFFLIIALMMFPGVLTLIPLYKMVISMGLLNTYWVVILPSISGGQVIAIFILRTFFASLPEELFEAARLDGASELQGYYHIALPLSVPVLGVIAIITLLSTWNMFIWPLLTLTEASMQPITVGLTYFAAGQFRTAYGPLMAGYTIASLPLLLIFLLFMRTFIEGMAAGAIKM
jgi:ABC-type glycerol-3-phosphate transport system permease component